MMYAVSEDIQGLVKAIDVVCSKAAQAARDGYQLIVLSDKLAGKRLVPIRYSPNSVQCFSFLLICCRHKDSLEHVAADDDESRYIETENCRHWRHQLLGTGASAPLDFQQFISFSLPWNCTKSELSVISPDTLRTGHSLFSNSCHLLGTCLHLNSLLHSP